MKRLIKDSAINDYLYENGFSSYIQSYVYEKHMKLNAEQMMKNQPPSIKPDSTKVCNKAMRFPLFFVLEIQLLFIKNVVYGFITVHFK